MFLVCRYLVSIGLKKTQKRLRICRKIVMKRKRTSHRPLGVCWGSAKPSSRCKKMRKGSIKFAKIRKIKGIICQP